MEALRAIAAFHRRPDRRSQSMVLRWGLIWEAQCQFPDAVFRSASAVEIHQFCTALAAKRPFLQLKSEWAGIEADTVLKLVQIQCVKCEKANPHVRVRYVGGLNPDGTRWKLSEDVAIAGMKEGKWRFWTAGDRRAFGSSPPSPRPDVNTSKRIRTGFSPLRYSLFPIARNKGGSDD